MYLQGTVSYISTRRVIEATPHLLAPFQQTRSFCFKKFFDSLPKLKSVPKQHPTVSITYLPEKELEKLCDENFSRKLKEASEKLQKSSQETKNPSIHK